MILRKPWACRGNLRSPAVVSRSRWWNILARPRQTALTAGVLAGSIYAGVKLRQKRLRGHEPYRYYDREQRAARTGTDD